MAATFEESDLTHAIERVRSLEAKVDDYADQLGRQNVVIEFVETAVRAWQQHDASALDRAMAVLSQAMRFVRVQS